MEEDFRSNIAGKDDVIKTPKITNTGSDEEESSRISQHDVIEEMANYPPECSDDSDSSVSEYNSDLFHAENDDFDSDISNPERERGVDSDRSVETSFQRELLDYLGSLFNVSSRIRTRDSRQTVTVTDEQLEEYKDLRDKVDREMKILGVGAMTGISSSDQCIARNLYFLLAARERGDWSCCRRNMRVVPMWTFETNAEDSANDCNITGFKERTVNKDEQGCAGDMCESLRPAEDLGEESVDLDEASFDGRGIATVRVMSDEVSLDIGARLCDQEHHCKEEEICLDREREEAVVSVCDDSTWIWNEVNVGKMTEISDCCKDDSKILLEREDNGISTEKLDLGHDNYENESILFNKSIQGKCSKEMQHYSGKRGVDSKEDDTLCYVPKKCKLDTNDGASEGMASLLTKVSRVGQKDLKSAIYGSRWSVRRLGLEARFPAHEGCVNALHFNSSGDWIASGSDDREVVITDWQNNKQLSRFTVGHSSNIFQVRFLPGSHDLELVTCSRDKSVRYAALSSSGQLQYSRLLTKHGDCCHKMDMPLDQPKLVISAGEDCKVLWSDVRSHKSCGQLCIVDKVPLYSISCNPVRSQELCVAGKDNRVYIFDRRSAGKSLDQLCPEQLAGKTKGGYHVTSVVYSGDGNSVLASYNDDDIYLLSTRPGKGPVTQHKYVGHRNVQTVTGVAFYGPRQEYVVSGSNDGHVLLWERDSEALVNWFLADEAGVVNVLEPHPFMPVLATSGLDHDIKVWSMLGADGDKQRGITVDDGLIERDQETSRIDVAWRTLAKTSQRLDGHLSGLPFNLRNLQVITALNWKMRSESCPYSFDNTLENLIFMSRRHGESQLRNLFISDSDSDVSIETSANDTVSNEVVEEGPNPGSPPRDTETDESTDRSRPDGCRSS